MVMSIYWIKINNLRKLLIHNLRSLLYYFLIPCTSSQYTCTLSWFCFLIPNRISVGRKSFRKTHSFKKFPFLSWEGSDYVHFLHKRINLVASMKRNFRSIKPVVEWGRLCWITLHGEKPCDEITKLSLKDLVTCSFSQGTD